MTLAIVASCGAGFTTDPGPGPQPITAQAPPRDTLDGVQVEAGRYLYDLNCASCHGPDLLGASDWKTPDEKGAFPPPPLDSTGHAWHHPDELLGDIIRGNRGYKSSMPQFADSLDDAQIAGIIEYLKSTWGSDERDFQWQVTWQARNP